MFGFFKKKRQPMAYLDERSVDVALRAAAMIGMSLFMCKSGNNFKGKLQSPYVRGYFVGFLDAASQLAKLGLKSDEEFFEFVIEGHIFLKDYLSDADSYAIKSLELRQDQEFSKGMSSGGKDYFKSLQSKLNYPRQLVRYFNDN